MRYLFCLSMMLALAVYLPALGQPFDDSLMDFFEESHETTLNEVEQAAEDAYWEGRAETDEPDQDFDPSEANSVDGDGGDLPCDSQKEPPVS